MAFQGLLWHTGQSLHLHKAAGAGLLGDIAKCIQANHLGTTVLAQADQRCLSELPSLLTEWIDVNLHSGYSGTQFSVVVI